MVTPPLSQRTNGNEHRKSQSDIMEILKHSVESLPNDSLLLKILESCNVENDVVSLREVLLAAVADITSKDQQTMKLGRAKDRVVGNLKMKKAEIQTLKSKLCHAQIEAKKVHTELNALRQEHEVLQSSHSTLKTKIHNMQGSAKESHATAQAAAQRLSREQKLRGLEQAVLEQFRELGRITGYARCGKAIRIAESNLAHALEEEK